MAFDKKSLDGYVEVKDRIIAFLEDYPDGRFQSEVVFHKQWTGEYWDRRDKKFKVGQCGLIAVKGRVFRGFTDPLPAEGHSWMNTPGTTPYTEGSEIENAETSAWGRALATMGYGITKSIASKDEIRDKSDGDDPLADEPAPKRERVTTEESQVPSKVVGNPFESGFDRSRIITPEVMLSEGQIVLATKILGALVALGKPAIVADATTKWGAVKGWPQVLFEKRYGHLVTEAKKAAGNDAERVKILENAEVPF